MKFPRSGYLASLFLIAIAVSLFTLSSCKEESNNPTFITLNLDGPNEDSPSLPPATYEAAVRFVSGSLQNYIDDRLVEVDFYVQEVPDACEVVIYRSNGGSEPFSTIHTANVISGLNANSWNTYVLTTPITISNEDIWIAIRFTHSNTARTIGCDPGPAVPNGDWLYDSNDTSWIPLSVRTPISINWNIRGIVDPS